MGVRIYPSVAKGVAVMVFNSGDDSYGVVGGDVVVVMVIVVVVGVR